MNDTVTGIDGAADGGAQREAADRPSLFCSPDGVCVNPHAAIPLDAQDSFARNFLRHFAAALGESAHAA